MRRATKDNRRRELFLFAKIEDKVWQSLDLSRLCDIIEVDATSCEKAGSGVARFLLALGIN